MRKIVLFDMDGTLTPPREPLDYNLVETLAETCKYAEIGIVSGSDYDYIMQQCGFLTTKDDIKLKLHILPCNGTKHYAPPSYRDQTHKLAYKENMRRTLGDPDFNTILKKLIDYQNHIVSHYDIPLTGHFISYRESMINWCPIGRNALNGDRDKFANFDKSFGTSTFRRTLLEQMREDSKMLESLLKLNSAEKPLLIFIHPDGTKHLQCNTFQILKFIFWVIGAETMETTRNCLIFCSQNALSGLTTLAIPERF